MSMLFGKVSILDVAVVVILMFFGMSGAIAGIAPNQANEMTGAAATHLQTVVGLGSQAVVDAVVLFLIYQHRTLFSRPVQFFWPGALALWAVFSTVWSQNPWLTVRRALPFLLAAVFGYLLTVRYPLRSLLTLCQVALLVLALWSAVLAVGFPAIGLDASTGHGSDWQGVFTQKNACGRAMVFALACVFAQGSLRTLRTWQICAVAVFALELVMSGSRGAWVIAVCLLAAWCLGCTCARFNRSTRMALALAAAAVACLAAVVFALEFSSIVLLLGRDPTLTGRTAIWQQVWIAILHRPVLGYGFDAFWQGNKGASWSVIAALGFVLFHAHNGFLEIWLELGAVGLALFAIGWLRGIGLVWNLFRDGAFAQVAWSGSILLLVLLYDLEENTLLSYNGLFWVLYVAAMVHLEAQSALQRSPATASIRPVPVPEPPGLVAPIAQPSWLPRPRALPWL